MITTLKSSFTFESKMPVDVATPGTVATPAGFCPVLGVLSFVPYTPAKLRFVGRLSAAPTSGELLVKLTAGGEIIGQASIDIIGLTVVSGGFDVSLAGVNGAAKLAFTVETVTGADAGITAQFDAALDIEQPISQQGGC